jgi:hypothetical protein
MLFHHIKKSIHQLAVFNGQDVVHILLYIREHQIAGGFYRHAVGNGHHLVQGDHMTCVHTGFHTRRARGLHPDHRHSGLDQLCKGGHSRGQTAPSEGTQMTSHRKGLRIT